ncbi:hypothetical protein N7468_010806 [Penicillium chermesinum]|uniref:PHD-type domain-containing protein n=1 Tax=Penicillium chermesinum TaxID=63820 RepID=A0A9W9N8B3_9EURO|nr:uncharacterized protein N7468_010806 [Penicillium chermesinum]KAJ5215127.1 hypothetical protein N7468_010806 [Penicillium chermesinum]
MEPSDGRSSRSGRTLKPPSTYVPAPLGRKVRKRPAKTNKRSVVCGICNRANSPNNNLIVFCDGCNETWHQRCHAPAIPEEVLKVEEAEWFCYKCRPAPPAEQQGGKSVLSGAVKPPSISHPRLRPRVPRESLASGESFSPDDRRAYLSALSHAELVELAMDTSIQHPSIPMFPSDMVDRTKSLYPTYTGPLHVGALETVQCVGAFLAGLMSPSQPRFSSPPLREKKLECFPKRKRTGDTSFAPLSIEEQPSPKRAHAVSAQPQPPATTSPASARTADSRRSIRSTPAAPLPKHPLSRSASEIQSHAALSYRGSTIEDSEPETEDHELDVIDDHRIYPPSGGGFPTPVTAAELDIIQETDDYPTFSHSLHGPAKNRHPGAYRHT